MKQLKFMLAAAAAFGIATAQADTQLVKTEISSEHFDAENITLNDTAALMDLSGFSYEGTASDNESVVVAGGANSTANALQVNTGTDPLLRKIDTDSNNAVALDATKKVYIDTMVQFTVTPEGDTVTAGDNDKLMIYLKEVPEVKAEDGSVTTPASTKLMVKAAKYTPANPLPPTRPASFEVVDAEITGVTVEPKKWYRLVVTSSLNAAGFAQFTIQLAAEGQELATLRNTAGLLATDDTVFPSLLGTEATSLDVVGFAGEGKVDELVFSKDVEQETSVDFTFTWSSEGISAVKYAIGDATEYTTLGDDKTIADLDPEATIKIQIVPAEWYAVKENADLEYTASEESADLNDLVTVVTTKVDPDTGDVVVNPGESVPVADIQKAAGIEDGAFAAPDTSKADLEKALTWKKKNNTSGKADINKITFSGVEPTSSEAEAYLLNCDPENLDDAKDNFKFGAFDPLNPPTADDFAKKGYNGEVVIEGATTLSVEDTAAENYGKPDWAVNKPGAKFYRARLVK